MNSYKYLPLFVAFIMLWSGYNLYSSIHYHHDIGVLSLFFFVIGFIYLADHTLRWLSKLLGG